MNWNGIRCATRIDGKMYKGDWSRVDSRRNLNI